MSNAIQANGEPWVIVFRSIHHVLAAERVFQEHGVWCDLVPVPRDLSSDCGMAIQFRPGDLQAVRGLVQGLYSKPVSVHRPSAGGHTDITAWVVTTSEPA